MEKLIVRCGVYYRHATRSVPVENGFKFIGNTRLDASDGPQKGKQTYWFESEAEFNKQIVGIIETIGRGAVHYPIPVFHVELVVEPEPVLPEPSSTLPESSMPYLNSPPPRKRGRPRKYAPV